MELEELDTNLVEIEEYKCRTCLFSSEKTMCFTQINQLCSPDKTVKDILIQMVPQMEATISEEDRVCRSCLKTILAYLRFVDKCLDIEAQLGQENEDLVKELEGEDTIESIQWADQADLDNAQVVENIEIVVENDLQSHFKPTKVISDKKQRTTSDHVYIKTEQEDSVDEGEEILPLEITEDGVSIDGTGELSADGVYDEYEDAFSNQEMITEDGELVEAEDGEIIQGVEYLQGDLKGVQIKQELNDEEDTNMYEVYMDPNCVICEVCGKFIRDQESLKRHLQTHNNTIYKCPECPKAFRARHLLKNHINSVHDPETIGIRLQCSKCPKLFKSKTLLAAHYRLKHDDRTTYMCQICNEDFSRADLLKKHLQLHTGDNPKKHKSTIPGKFLRFKNTGTDDPLPCKICGKFYNGINKLKVHLQTHVVVKRYQCEYCNLTYKRWPSLKRHEKTHTEADENFHRCNVCWKRLKSEEELKLHMASHGNPKYQCHICDEQFHRKYLFDNHYLLEHATPEDLENSKKEIIYDTLLELSTKLE